MLESSGSKTGERDPRDGTRCGLKHGHGKEIRLSSCVDPYEKSQFFRRIPLSTV